MSTGSLRRCHPRKVAEAHTNARARMEMALTSQTLLVEEGWCLGLADLLVNDQIDQIGGGGGVTAVCYSK